MASSATTVRDRWEDHSTTTVQQSHQVDEEQADPKSASNDELSSPSKQHASPHILFLLRNLLLLLGNIIAWYITNGMNGIALQSFSSHVRDYRAGKEGLFSNIALMLLVTGTQLLFGVVMGMAMLSIFSLMKPASQRNRQFKLTMAKQDVILGSLHGIGSLCTNLGFSYGSASLIQILKLLEPFETIILSQLLMPDEGKITIGVVSSMIFVVGAAVSLIRIRPTKPHAHAVLFAILSGLTLSSRNVLQRKQHVQADAQHDEDNTKHTSKVERSIEQFTKLSFNSAVVTLTLAIPLNVVLLATSTSHVNIVKMVLDEALNWRVLTWHPLYNAFSVITLGFCSALTHSLLNAGKRVFAILMAIVWFREDFTMATVLGLLAVGAGGCWYTVETKAKRTKVTASGISKWMKLAVSVALLQTLLHSQGMIKRE
jgi:drug/metabolite transporter (DMT)-like permease